MSLQEGRGDAGLGSHPPGLQLLAPKTHRCVWRGLEGIQASRSSHRAPLSVLDPRWAGRCPRPRLSSPFRVYIPQGERAGSVHGGGEAGIPKRSPGMKRKRLEPPSELGQAAPAGCSAAIQAEPSRSSAPRRFSSSILAAHPSGSSPKPKARLRSVLPLPPRSLVAGPLSSPPPCASRAGASRVWGRETALLRCKMRSWSSWSILPRGPAPRAVRCRGGKASRKSTQHHHIQGLDATAARRRAVLLRRKGEAAQIFAPRPATCSAPAGQAGTEVLFLRPPSPPAHGTVGPGKAPPKPCRGARGRLSLRSTQTKPPHGQTSA